METTETVCALIRHSAIRPAVALKRIARMMAMTLVKCPTCGNSFDLAARERPGGMTGGSFCPQCHERFAFPGPSKAVTIVSLIIAMVALTLAGVRSIVGLVIGTALLWVPIYLFLNAARMRRKGVVIRKWEPRRRTFFEWLYERDQIRASKMFDDDKKDS
jgi:hypothetical protein